MGKRTVTALLLTLLLAACASTRPAMTLTENFIFEADPAALMLAMQTNAEPQRFRLNWSVNRKADERSVSEGELLLTRAAAGREVDFDLPAARDGQSWSVWVLDDDAQKTLLRAQSAVREAKQAGQALTYSAGFNWGGDADSFPEVVYMTYAVRLGDGDWLTLMDNTAMVPERTDEAAH